MASSCALQRSRFAPSSFRPLRHAARQRVISCHGGAATTLRLPAYAPKLASVASFVATVALGCAAVGGQCSVDAACVAAFRVNTLFSGILFLAYFCASIAAGTVPSMRLGAMLRPSADQLLAQCSLTVCMQLALLAVIASIAPPNIGAYIAPLFGAAYASFAILVATQQAHRRPLRARKKLELEPGEGDRHALVAQGGRLAARNYCWLMATLYFGLECCKCTLRAGQCQPLHALPEALLFVGYVAAGVMKFGPFNGE